MNMNSHDAQQQQGRRVRRARQVPSDRQFSQVEALKRSGTNARTYVQVILILAALTTFSTGAISVWGNSSWDGLTMLQTGLLVLRGVIVGATMLALADGSRWGWGNARTADQSTGWMQGIAYVMEGVNFSISAFVSVIGLAPLLIWLGLPARYDAVWVQSAVLLLLQVSFFANIAMGFVWMVLSPKSVQLTAMAALENEKLALYLLKVKKFTKAALQNEGNEIEAVMQQMVDDRMLDGFNRFLEMNGFELAQDDEAGTTPPPAGDERPRRRRRPANVRVTDHRSGRQGPPESDDVKRLGGYLAESGFGAVPNGGRPSVNGRNGSGD